MYIKAKDLRAGMVIELTMKASYHARKKMVTQKVEIEEDVFYNTGDEEVLVDFVECVRVELLCSLQKMNINGFNDGNRKKKHTLGNYNRERTIYGPFFDYKQNEQVQLLISSNQWSTQLPFNQPTWQCSCLDKQVSV